MKVKQMLLMVIIVLLVMSMGCNLNQFDTEKESATGETTSVSRDFVPNLKNDSEYVRDVDNYYVDIGTSATDMFLLYRTGESSFLDKYSLYDTTGSYSEYRTIMLDCIDYVSDTWGVIGADNTNKQIKINCMHTTPDYVFSYPSGINRVGCIAGKQVSTNTIDIWIAVPTSTYGTLLKKGTFSHGDSNISWGATGTTRFHGIYDQGMAMDGNYIYKNFSYMPSYFKRQTTLNGPSTGEVLSPYTSHGYYYNGTLTSFSPSDFDFTTYGNDYIYGLEKRSGDVHIVRMLKSNLEF